VAGPGFEKGFPSSTGSAVTTFQTPKKAVVCTGFAVRSAFVYSPAFRDLRSSGSRSSGTGRTPPSGCPRRSSTGSNPGLFSTATPASIGNNHTYKGKIIPLQRGGIANGMIYILIILNSYWISIIVIFGYPFCTLLWSRRKPLLFKKRFSGYCRTEGITRVPTGSTGASKRVPATGATATGTT